MTKYNIEMRREGDIRQFSADAMHFEDGWIVLFTKLIGGGIKECFRVREDVVASIETVPG